MIIFIYDIRDVLYCGNNTGFMSISWPILTPDSGEYRNLTNCGVNFPASEAKLAVKFPPPLVGDSTHLKDD